MPQDQITQMQFCTALGVLNLPRARGCSRHLGKPWLPLKVLFFFFLMYKIKDIGLER